MVAISENITYYIMCSQDTISDVPIKRMTQKQEPVSAPRDPRFDPRCSGSYDFRHFSKNYAFLEDVRKDELNKLQRALNKEKNSEKKAKIKATISRIKNKIVEANNKTKKLETTKELKGQQGGKYKNIKKSQLKKKLIVDKYKELKESGKLSKYLERKRKKLINRDRSIAGHSEQD